ncbi:LysR family transcriptional regulator [Alloactinosynnema sp. L-07]|uniref:LysR family transcriptional regulator n=1 Tax=Alloactinosynnema sp. L-07 TaxID=1653480 RepID=UPI0006B54D4E|nr:LysR family transcriptional regulator [Alloactinosynnema sp. L-07]
MDIVRLSVFREVAVLGSFTAAARSLRYTQSAVSRQIAALEEDVAAVLFDRVPRGVRLTDEGRCLLGHADAVLDRLDAARRDLTALREVDTGRLRIGAFATAEAVLVPRAMAAFQAAHPRVELSLSDGLTAAHIGRLRAGELDVAVLAGSPGSVEGLALHHLLDDPLLVALPTDHRFAGRRTLRLTELAGESWIAGSTTVEDTLIGMCLRSGFRPSVRYVVQEWTAKQGLVAAGLGITLVPGLAATALRPDILVKRLHADEASPRAIYAAVVDRRPRPPAVQRFLDYLTESAALLLHELSQIMSR